MSEPEKDADDEKPKDRLATLGEILEAHHFRFVAKVRRAEEASNEGRVQD